MESQDSIEFLVARSTDPFLEACDRQVFFEKLLCEINKQYDAPQTAFQLLSHKLLSPDQVETLQTLQVLDQLVRQAGCRVAVEVGKFKFLNNFIRLLSPKYQGMSTSEAVRLKSIELLYLWKESLRHLEKIQEVYQLLKKQNIIEEDPKPHQQIPTIHCFPNIKPRLATFEDEQKAQLLADLLRSSKPEDLQTANQMIKSMVRAEDQKMQKYHKRKEVLETAASTSEALWSMLAESADGLQILTTEWVNGNGGKQNSQDQYNTMKMRVDNHIHIRHITSRKDTLQPILDAISTNFLERVLSPILVSGSGLFALKLVIQALRIGQEEDLFASLQAFRPTLFRYASEAAETTDESSEEKAQWVLADILALNDQINRTMQAFKDKFGTIKENHFQSTSNSSKEKDLISIAEWETSNYSSLDDVNILCSISAANSPATLRKVAQLQEDNLSEKGNCAEDPLVTQTNNIMEELKDLDLVQAKPTETVNQKQHKKGSFLLDDVSVTAHQLEIVTTAEPIVLVQQNQLHAILYRSIEKDNNSLLLKSAVYYIVIVNSTNPLPICNVQLEMRSANSLVNSRLLRASSTKLKAFNPIAPVENITQVFVLLPLTDTIKKAEVHYAITFTVQNRKDEKHFEGYVTVEWS